MPFYPNECYICQSTVSLKRCSRCNMISYCGEPHQRAHWNYHKDICKKISDLMKEINVSHIMERLRNASQKAWIVNREELRHLVESRMSRCFGIDEVDMFRFPRACFVCHDSRQDLLRNCPGCPLATFCPDHPNSPSHDKDCSTIKKFHDFQTLPEPDAVSIKSVLSKMITHRSFSNDSPKQPNSVSEFIDASLKHYQVPEVVKFYVSEHLSIPLTILNALRKLKNSRNGTEMSSSKMVFLVRGIGRVLAFTNSWETLLHLVPGLNDLTIILTDLKERTKMEVTLCHKCNSKKKKLTIEDYGIPYLEYIKSAIFKNPDLVAVYNVAPPERCENELEVMWKVEVGTWNLMNCPVVLTNSTQEKFRLTKESLCAAFSPSRICYGGNNDFTTSYPIREWKDWGLCKNNDFLIVIKQRAEAEVKATPRAELSFAKTIENHNLLTKKPSKTFFYPTLCRICKSTVTPVMCKRCKMVFYCGENHQKDDLPYHKDICKIILGMMIEAKTTNIFEEFKTCNTGVWLKNKLHLMEKVKSKIGRDLEEYEKQMFLFPKTCFFCHESDLTILKSCECGITFCALHRNSVYHKEICNDYSLAKSLKMLESPPEVSALVKPEFFTRSTDILPPSMESFMDSYIFILPGIRASNPSTPKMRRILFSDALSIPLSLMYALGEFDFSYGKKLKVHILGTIHREVCEEGFWLMLNWLRSLKKLQLSFFDSDVSKLPFDYSTKLGLPDHVFSGKKGLEVIVHKIKYEDYMKLNHVEKPHLVVGYNLNIHEIDYGICQNNWKEIFSILGRINVPFIMTSGSGERARKDQDKLCSFLGRKVDYTLCRMNPYCSLVPERDIETERLLYSNKYITVYTDFQKTSIYDTPCLTVPQLERKERKICKPNPNDECKIVEFKSVEKVESSSETKNKKVRIETNELLLRKNLTMANIDKLIEQNDKLRKENEEIRNENKKLREDSERLASENKLIKDFRQQVNECIQLAMKENT